MSQSLNPCCSGRWSRTVADVDPKFNPADVLILVVVEDGLVLSHLWQVTSGKARLNPYCSGRQTRTVQAANGSENMRLS